jgi:hypothetical protein
MKLGVLRGTAVANKYLVSLWAMLEDDHATDRSPV